MSSNGGLMSVEDFKREAAKPDYVAAMENALKRCVLARMSGAPDYTLYDMFVPEYTFYAARRWRFDYAIPELKVALELEGLVWGKSHGSGKSRHTENEGYAADCRKYSRAACLGWLVIRATPDMVYDGTALALVLETMATHPTLWSPR